MAYQTILFRLMKPTARKQKQLEEAQKRYSEALEWLLRQMKRETCETGSTQCSAALLARLQPKEAGPFKDALRREAQGILKSYLRRRAEQGRAAYPVTRTEAADLEKLVSGLTHFSSYEYSACLSHFEKNHPVSFCRYDTRRDFSLLRGPDGARYYARLTLFDKQNAVAADAEEKGLADVQTGELLHRRGGRQRYLLLPLEMGKRQLEWMRLAESGEYRAKSAQLIAGPKGFELAVHFWRPDPPEREARGTLGVCRGENGRLYCCRRDQSGAEESFFLEESPELPQQTRVHLLAGRLAEAALQRDDRMVFENFKTASDGLAAHCQCPMPAEEYGLICRAASQKALALGLPRPLAVSPLALFHRCPQCGALRRGTIDRGVFFCTVCGESAPLGRLGARNLAQTPGRYDQSLFRVQVRKKAGRLVFSCPALRLTVETQEGPEAAECFFQRAEALLKAPEKGGRRLKSIALQIKDVNLREKFIFI